MIDSLMTQLERAQQSTILSELKFGRAQICGLTLHRPSNVDEQNAFARILDALAQIGARVPIVFPAHPRTRKMIEELGLGQRVAELEGFQMIEPVGYLDFLRLMSGARLVLTDSGGIQEETTVLGIPCITLRENTERPITCEMGTNTLAGTDTKKIVRPPNAPWTIRRTSRIFAFLTFGMGTQPTESSMRCQDRLRSGRLILSLRSADR
jgi:UDP-N-acetylglucosamine 2-epimerase (non-hydrolysing)